MNKNLLLDKAINWVIAYGPRIVLAIIVAIAGIWLIRMLRKYLVEKLLTSKLNDSLRPFIQSLTNTILNVLLLLALMQILGIQMTIFAAIIGGIGVAAGLSLSGTLQNFASGILILLLKPFEVGENILAQGLEGTVTTIRIFSTVVTTFDNRIVIIPNSKLSNEIIINISREGKRRLDIDLKFNYGINIEEVKNAIYKSLQELPNVLTEPKVRIGISKLEPDGYIVTSNIWINAHGFYDIKIDLQEKIINGLKSNGIKMPGMA